MERISDERLKELIYMLDVTDNPEAASALRELVRLREGWVSVKDRLPEITQRWKDGGQQL